MHDFLRDKLNFSRYVLPYILPKLNNVTLTENQNAQFAPVEIDIKDLFRIGDYQPTKDEI